MLNEVLGRADVTVDTNGILIRKDKKEGIDDLIDEALKYNGQLPSNVTPIAPVQRSRPAPPGPKPATQNVVQPPPTVPATPTPRDIKP
jgi:hypothetical protein